MHSTHGARLVPIAGLLLGLVWGGAAPAAERYEGYHRLTEVEAALAAWASEHPKLIVVRSIGESAGGHSIQVARVAQSGTIAPDERPAIFVGANVAGFHNAGSEAALELIGALIEEAAADDAGLLSQVTFYVAPALNPDAHDGMFAAPRVRLAGNGMRLDRDRDGFEAEDGNDDLNGDGRITQMRIPDPTGEWLPHPKEPRLMVEQDSAKGWVGTYRLVSEGDDDDGDGSFNEDPREGVVVDESFPHAFPYPKAEAGPWSSYAPETKAVLDYLFDRRNVALAVVYGPANNLLAMPESLGGAGDVGSQKFKLPKFAAEMLGFDPEGEYTIDEVWEVAKDQAFVRQMNITKERLAQFLGAGPATKVDDEDLAVLGRLAKTYKKALEEAGLDDERPGKQYLAGGMTPWLYYQLGVLALELDVWGVPKAKKEAKQGEPLTLDRLEKMSSEEFLALDESVIAGFLKEIGAPPQMSAARLIERVRGGQATPAQMAQMARRFGGGGGAGSAAEDDRQSERQLEILAWLEEHDPTALAPWTAVTLRDGSEAEVGGRDPFAEIAPPMELLRPALKTHTQMVLDMAGQLPRVEIVSLEVADLGGGIYRVEAVAANRGQMATHTKMGVKARSRLPIRLELATDGGVELVTGQPVRAAERLEGSTGTVAAEWLVRARQGASVTVRLLSENAGHDQETQTVSKGASR